MLDRPDVLDLFAAQHGVATIAQLRALTSSATVARARKAGAIEDVITGVVRLRGAPDTFWLRAMVAQLHSGEQCFVSGFSAGIVHGLKSMIPKPICVTTVRYVQSTTPPWVRRIHSPWRVIERDAMLIRGLRVERPHQTLFTLAWLCNDVRFERAAESAWNRKLVTPSSCRVYLEAFRRSGRPGVARFEKWLDKVGARTRAMQSNFEIDVLDAIRAIGLPEPEKQYPLELAPGEPVHLDLAWPDCRLAIEPGDSWFHRGDRELRRDQARDDACGELGWLIIRFDETARDDLAAVARKIADVYHARQVSPAFSP